MKKRKIFVVVAFLIVVIILGACAGSKALPTDAVPVVTDEPAAPQSSSTSTPTGVVLPIQTKPDPTRVEFQSADGTLLVGYYYPAAMPNAPLVVLMHWAGGDQTDWNKVGLVEWLRNWPQAAAGSSELTVPPSDVYVPMPSGMSFAVFTFDYRGYGESGGFKTRTDLVDDSMAALTQASKMEWVDPLKISAIGSSIGADGAVDSCAGFPCVGVFSFSPGSYLGIPYHEAINLLSESGNPVRCVASEDDWESFTTCNKASGDNYKSIIYQGRAHGTEFLLSEKAPEGIGQVLLDWLLQAYNFK